MRSNFISAVSAITPLEKNDKPNNLELATCIVSADVVEHIVTACWLLRLTCANFPCLKAQDLVNDADQNPEEACTSRLQTWYRKGNLGDIVPQPIMDIILIISMTGWGTMASPGLPFLYQV